ncbi:hypothetical protein JCM19037_4392 [Geomicrobium sp. JCM 19037]|uniref:YvrJ family protein n=1 Tax=Geomicrobium sp. JCM 19037 TaxID=1460634 RepID=UPI00045F409C|nr:YvrJ family protein [Geomicrobium sp. JCM 19037]GAK05860.1 hypothetical protein JCM19037_4392 [Geomicrobium sp. JCM 19037]
MFELTTFVELFANYGFPVVISFYLLFRFERRLERLEQLLIQKVSEENDSEKEIG